jgi:hypothetical protein
MLSFQKSNAVELNVNTTSINLTSLKKLSDAALIEGFKNLILREKRLGDLILLNLQEMNSRRIYAQLGYGSLFEFLVKYFHLSESSAYQRINAMKLIQCIPEARAALVAGETNLSTMAATQGFIRKLESEKKADLSLQEKKDIFEAVKGKTQKEAQAAFVTINPMAALPANKEKPLTANHTLLQVTVDQETLQLLQEVKSLLSHEIPDGDLGKIFKKISKESLEILKNKKGRNTKKKIQKPDPQLLRSESRDKDIVEEIDHQCHRTEAKVEIIDHQCIATDYRLQSTDYKLQTADQQFPENHSAHSTKDSNFRKIIQKIRVTDHQTKRRSSKHCDIKKTSRYIPIEIRRLVFEKAQGRCEFLGSDGRRCESHYQLEIDHKLAWSQGGSHNEANLRCLCKVHNTFRTKETHGFWWRDLYR